MKGQKFGRYTVLREAGRAKNGLVTWECRCDCGTVRVVAGSTLRRGNTKSCGCLRSDLNAERNRQLRLSKPWEAEFNNFLSQANYRGLTCNLKLTDFTTLVTSPCVYCGQPPHAEPKTVLMREAGEKRHGVDRMDPSKGYIGGNCVSCCKDCNLAKGSLTFNEFIETIKRRYHHLQNQGHV